MSVEDMVFQLYLRGITLEKGQEESDNSLPLNVKKSYDPSSSSSSRKSSSNRSALHPVQKEALSQYVQSSLPVSVQSSIRE